MATLLKADGTVSEVTPANGRTFTLDELQGYVGGYIERVPRVPITRLLVNQIMFCNEDGKGRGLPLNGRATRLSGLFPDDLIVGDVIVCTLEELE